MNKLNNETLDQMAIIAKIAARAVEMANQNKYTRMTAIMDISTCNSSCPLRLDDLLAADDFNFAHDVFGINQHLNRETGELNDCFLPRFAKPEPQDVPEPEKPKLDKLADWQGRWLKLDGYAGNVKGMTLLLELRFGEVVETTYEKPGYTLFTTESGLMLSSNGYVFTDHDERVTTAKLVRIAMTERIKDHTNPNPGWTTIRTSAACLGDSCELPARIIMSLTPSGERVTTHLETFMQATNTRSRSSLNFGHYFPVDQMDKAIADYKSRCKATGVRPHWSRPGEAKAPLGKKPETMDLTPTPDSYRAMLRLIIKDSPVSADVEWATKELAKVKNVIQKKGVEEKKMDKEKLQLQIDKHTKWLNGEEGDERADLRSDDLCDADLSDAAHFCVLDCDDNDYIEASNS